MTDTAFRALVEAAAQPYRASGRYAWHFAKGKLNGDPVFRFLLSNPVLPAGGRLLDLGCGQGVLMALLRAAADRSARGNWPAEWPDRPPLRLHGVELSPRRARVAKAALGEAATLIQGDIREVAFPACTAIVILDVLLYLAPEEQAAVLTRCVGALEPGGVLILREADADAGLRFRITRGAEQVAGWLRGQGGRRLTYRPATGWVRLLESLGLTVSSRPMSDGTPFGNVLFVARQDESKKNP